MANKSNTEIIKEIDDKIIFHTSSFSKLIVFLEKHEQIDQFYKTINKDFSLNDISTFREQLNFAGYLKTMTLDLLVISKGLIISTHPWEKILHYRLGYTLIYEVISTYHNHLKINKLIRAWIASNDLQKEVSIELKVFKKKYNFPKAFEGIRNKALAHIDSDLKLYYNEINRIDEIIYCNAIVEFLQILYKMQAVSTNLSEILFLGKEGEPINKTELMKDLHEKIERSLETTKQV